MDTIAFIAVFFILVPAILFFIYNLIKSIYILFWSTRKNWTKMSTMEFHWGVFMGGLITPLFGIVVLFGALIFIISAAFNYYFGTPLVIS